MGLDMYLVGEVYHEGASFNNTPNPDDPREKIDCYPVQSSRLECGYWRKHPDLHGYIVNTFADGEDKCQKIYLTAEECNQVADALLKDELPHTEGFFFGKSEWHEETKKEDAEQFRKAARWLEKHAKSWRHNLFYQASW